MGQLVTPEQVFTVARRAGVDDASLKLSGIAVLTFSKSVIDRLEELCALKGVPWLSSQHHPYAVPDLVKRGSFRGMEVTVLVPPMGASPLSCTIEDLVACGLQAVFLVCGAWSLGPPVGFGDLIVPAFSMGPDGTSIHYGNDGGYTSADPIVVEALTGACRERGAKVRVGGNATCEALYRITSEMAKGFRTRGCLCMENGEVTTLFAATKMLGVVGGALLQPYVELEKGWDPARLDETYRNTCRIQAEVVLEASVWLKEKGLLG